MSLRSTLRPYRNPNPLQCYTCYKYGHHERRCNKAGSEGLCRHCCEAACTHDSANCKNSIKCANCGGEHIATSRTCPVWKREKEIVTVKYRESLSFPEARKIVDSRHNLTNLYSKVTKPIPKEVKDAQTQTVDVAVQTNSQTKPENVRKKTQKPTESSKVTKDSSQPSGRSKSPKKCQSDRIPMMKLKNLTASSVLTKTWKQTQTMQNNIQISKVASSKSIIDD